MCSLRRTCALMSAVTLLGIGGACGSFGGTDDASRGNVVDEAGVDGSTTTDAGSMTDPDAGSTPDASTVLANDPCPDAGPHRFMFVTNDTFRGDLGRDAGTTGRAVADVRCNEAAHAGGLPGTYVAWLSTTKDHPIVTPMKGVAIVLPRACEVLAADLVALSSQVALKVAPSATELGGTLSGPCPVWSNTTVNGTSAGMETCLEWTSADAADNGAIGDCSSTDYEWSTFGVLSCDNANAHLYCLQN